MGKGRESDFQRREDLLHLPEIDVVKTTGKVICYVNQF